jgi:preprotein translocase subunit SecG
MEIAKGILIVIYFMVALILIILTLIQSKDDAGLSSTITGSSTNNFFEKNKGRTKEGKQKRWTIILSIVFAILTIALGILYMAK